MKLSHYWLIQLHSFIHKNTVLYIRVCFLIMCVLVPQQTVGGNYCLQLHCFVICP